LKNPYSTISRRILLFSKVDGDIKSYTKDSSWLFKSSAGIITIRVISRGLAFIISLILARLLGAKEYGIYVYSLGWIGFLFVPTVIGFDRLLIRDISVCKTRSDWSLMRGLVNLSQRAAMSSSFIVVVAAVFISIGLGINSDPIFMHTFFLALILIPISVLVTLKQSILKGLEKVVLGHVPEMLIKPFLLLLCLLLIYILGFKEILSSSMAVAITIFASLISLWTVHIILKRELPSQIHNSPPVYNMKVWIKSALPLSLIGGMLVINSQTDIIMLGAIRGPKETGIYSIANAFSGLITFVLISVNASLAPSIASLYTSRNMLKLQNKITLSARLIFCLSLPVGIIIILFGKFFLSIYGADFVIGLSSLRILCIGQLVNAAAGSVGLLLIMTGHERDSAWGIGFGAVFNVVLNFLLIPLWGIEGAAIATSSSMVIWNVILIWFVWKRLGIYSTALGKIR